MYKKILVPLDSSELAECALTEVKKLMEEGFPREVTLLSVFEIPLFPTEASMEHYASIRRAQIKKLQMYLEDVRCRIATEGISINTEVKEGNAALTIIDYAKAHDVDLIVIATHGYSGMKRLVFGSVALQLLHDSNVPVLLIRPESCRM